MFNIFQTLTTLLYYKHLLKLNKILSSLHLFDLKCVSVFISLAESVERQVKKVSQVIQQLWLYLTTLFFFPISFKDNFMSCSVWHAVGRSSWKSSEMDSLELNFMKAEQNNLVSKSSKQKNLKIQYCFQNWVLIF